MEDKYKSMTVPELAAEDAFIRWVILGENHASWSQWQQQNPDKHNTIAEAKHFVSLMTAFQAEPIPAKDKDDLWNRINHSIRQKESTPVRKTYSFIRWSIAAAAVFALLIWINSLQGAQKIIAQNGDQKEIILPESSLVILNADTRIVYHKGTFTDERELTLEGEAFFKVQPGNQFIVHTSQGDITVLGTSFNVIARPGRFEVSCHTGKVRVTNGADGNVVISAGEKAIEEQAQLRVDEFSASAAPAWTEGKFVFDDQPLSVVFGELERQYNVKVELPPELGAMRYTGLFESGNLDTALHIITWPLRLRYEMKGKSAVVISR